MAYGLQVYNDSGYLQIDGENPNIGLAAKGTITATVLEPNGYIWSYNLTVSSLTFPMLALSGAAFINSVTNTGSTYTWTIYSYTATFQYFVFDTSVGIPVASGYGMNVYNAAGTRVYTTNVKPLRVLGRITATPTGFTSSSYGSGKQLAVLQIARLPCYVYKYYTTSGSNPSFYDENQDAYQYYASTPMSTQTLTGVVSSMAGLANMFYYPEAGLNPPPAQSYDYFGGWDFWVLDVTGY